MHGFKPITERDRINLTIFMIGLISVSSHIDQNFK